MELTDADFNAALSAFLMWGPERLKPDEQRMVEAVPGLSIGDAKALAVRFHKISVASSAVLTAGLRAGTPESSMRTSVAAIDSRVSPANAGTLYFQARHGAWRDGEG